MSMFCFQCQETAKGTGCTVKGVCGKTDDVAQMQDLLIYVLKGISILAIEGRKVKIENEKVNRFITDSLFMTITNANFDKQRFISQIVKGLEFRGSLQKELENSGAKISLRELHDAATWIASPDEFPVKAATIGVQATINAIVPPSY